jgi:ribonuclease P protein component
MERLKRRAEFQAVARGRKVSRPGFVLQALDQAGESSGKSARFGFTVTRKIGNAVVRNRIRRRLREAVRLSAVEQASPGTDYVLIGRRAALHLPFDQLIADLTSGIVALARDAGPGNRQKNAG